MGKAKSKKKGSEPSAAAKKCACDHPYRCQCGNRPERPSKGHKWDPATQQWGGKGHKQKGASGQTATVAQADQVTSGGGVVLKQWQKLPSRLLADLVKKNGKGLGRGMPIYRPVGNRGGGRGNEGGRGGRGNDSAGRGNSTNSSGQNRYRLIIPSTSKKHASDHDIVLVPSLSVPNDEQAKEEAALLGLLYLFPTLPHERTLPEPYRSTLLAARKNRTEEGGRGDEKSGEKKTMGGTNETEGAAKSSASKAGGAAANVQLTANLPSFSKRPTNNNHNCNAKAAPSNNSGPLLTRAQQTAARAAHRREIQARIRKHEAIRAANRPMEVFMSARFRGRIERLLAGEAGEAFDDENEEMDEDNDGMGAEEGESEGGDEEEDVVRSYVRQRLLHEGFAAAHVSKAYREVASKSKGNLKAEGSPDERMDRTYEATLQYLCIHLREDQLPIGFDPRGGTLDVLRPAKKAAAGAGAAGAAWKATGDKSKRNVNEAEQYDAAILRLTAYFGLKPREAAAIASSDAAAFASSDEATTKRAFWKVLATAAALPVDRTCFMDDDDAANSILEEERQRNEEAARNELEALEAIFAAGECAIEKNDDTTCVSIALPFGESKLLLDVHYRDGMYPDRLPMALVTSGSWNDGGRARTKGYRCGGRVNLKLAQCLSEMPPGQEAVFELFGRAQMLLQDEEAKSYASTNEVSELLALLQLDDGDERTETKPNQQPTAPESGGEATDTVKAQPAAQTSKRQPAKPLRRPPARASFWNAPPNKTPPAEPFPKVSSALDRARKSLPAANARGEFLALLQMAQRDGRVVLVTGETGCGKTTQIPQFVLEHSPAKSKIVVAQPRRLAATGVAARVALERGEPVPGQASVGYVVRGDSKVGNATRLLFCTTGVLLRQLQSQDALRNVTHVVIDEVHERHLDTDVLLAILKKTLPSLPNLTVVLMSATMDADRFAQYWGAGTPRMHIPGFTHPVEDFTLEDVLEMTNYIPPRKKKKQQHYPRGGGGGKGYHIQPSFVDGDDVGDDGDEEDPEEKDASASPAACAVPLEERLKRINESAIDYDLIAILIQTLLNTKDDDGSILVFLPGAGEIDKAERAMQNIVRGHAVTVLQLHGGLPSDRQQQVFVPARKGYTKVILATNVAETSITIPDCTVVVDTCKEKQSSFDPVNRMPLLLERFASRDSLKQRRGRAGRVRPGTCYKLVSRPLLDKLPQHGEAEILRCALDQTLLGLLFLGLEDGTGDFLRLFLDPPSKQQIESALDSLEKLGALRRDGTRTALTPLGTHLAGIPAPPAVGKLLVMGTLLGCRDMAVAIASGLSVGRSPFLRINNAPFHRQHSKGDADPEKERTDAQVLKERAALFQQVGNSDHALLGKAFLLWKECQGASERRRFCERYGLAFNSMRDMLALARQLDSALTTSGFHPSKECNQSGQSGRIIRSMLVASLSPTQVVRVQRPSTKYTETVEGSIEKEGKAKELKFFIRGGSDDNSGEGSSDLRIRDGVKEERVFMHPSSHNFAVGSYSCPWLVYHRLVRTSKAFVSDATECNPYALLLFGGAMEVRASQGVIVLDDWIRLSANARIGSLIGGLRQKVDELLERKVADPSLDIAGSTEMKLITDLLRHDGV
ncbi:hypothetical protein ACHAXT_000184 [Thalassiosira profunda]